MNCGECNATFDCASALRILQDVNNSVLRDWDMQFFIGVITSLLAAVIWGFVGSASIIVYQVDDEHQDVLLHVKHLGIAPTNELGFELILHEPVKPPQTTGPYLFDGDPHQATIETNNGQRFKVRYEKASDKAVFHYGEKLSMRFPPMEEGAINRVYASNFDAIHYFPAKVIKVENIAEVELAHKILPWMIFIIGAAISAMLFYWKKANQ